MMLDHLYRAIYFHHAVRSASGMLASVLRRALELGPSSLFPPGCPLALLLQRGSKIDLEDYCRVGEYLVWTRIEEWRRHTDRVISDLATRLMSRNLFKAVTLFAPEDYEACTAFVDDARRLAIDQLGHVDSDNVDHYVLRDYPERKTYAVYSWRPTSPNKSVFIVYDQGSRAMPLEEFPESRVVSALKKQRRFSRVMFPPEIRGKLLDRHPNVWRQGI